MAIAILPDSNLHHKLHICSPTTSVTIDSINFRSYRNKKVNSVNPFIPAGGVSNFILPQRRRQLRWQLFSTDADSPEKEPIIRSSSTESSDEENHDLGVKAALCVLKFYKTEISPILPRSCRFVPTCSEYSMIAYKKYGFVKGTILTTWRICRCNPLGGNGFDPPRWFDEEEIPPDR